VLKLLKDIGRSFLVRLVVLITATVTIAIALEAWFWFSLPPIVRGLPGGFILRGHPQMDRAFKERIKVAFPAGMAEGDLVRDLQSQGFTGPFTWRDVKFAESSVSSFPCRHSFIIEWRVDELGAASSVTGHLNHSCL
jgi:hypothetical protein